jgi:hypothetical protein
VAAPNIQFRAPRAITEGDARLILIDGYRAACSLASPMSTHPKTWPTIDYRSPSSCVSTVFAGVSTIGGPSTSARVFAQCHGGAIRETAELVIEQAERLATTASRTRIPCTSFRWTPSSR